MHLTVPQIDSDAPKEWLSSLGLVAETAIRWWNQWGMTAVVIAAVVVAAAVILRLRNGRNARRHRHSVLLKPSSQFDPSPEEVLRFCGQLSRVNSATARITVPRSTRTVRIRLVHAGEGRMAQLLEAPSRAEQILRHRGFAQVELADPATVGKQPISGPVSETNQLHTTEPSSAQIDAGLGHSNSSEVDPLDPDLAVSAEDWVDSDHGGYLDDPPEDPDWMHPEDQRLYPIPNGSPWAVLNGDKVD